MSKSKSEPHYESTPSQTLRARANVMLGTTRGDVSEMSIEEVQALVHELQVHQVELEIQNEELRAAQVELFESRSRYSDLYDFAPVGYLTLGRDGEILESNLTASEILGMLRKELSGLNITRLVAPEDQDSFYLHRQKVLSSGATETCELAMRRGDGLPIVVRLESVAVQETNEDLTETHCRSALIDITEQRRAEEMANQAERLKRMVENLPAGAVYVEDDRVFMNRAAEEITGYDRNELTTRDQWFGRLYGGRQTQARRVYDENRNAGFRKLSPTTVTRPDGDDRDIEVAAHGFEDQEVWFLHDTTDQKLAEKRLIESLHEKETLLREIHHRVKNNLQIVSSLLHFHGRKLADENARQIIREAQSRLTAMSLVHEQLYGAGTLSGIGFAAYLEQLAGLMAGVGEAEGSEIELMVGDSHVSLPIETALPLGLIVHELVTNALKHAFENDVLGRIEIRLTQKDQTLELEIADNGRGLPESVDPRHPQGFGLQLVRDLSAQIGATVSFRREGGTRATVVLPDAEPA